MSCKCQECGKQYKVGWVIPDGLWEQIKPANKLAGTSLLCGTCIANRVELISEYNVLNFCTKSGDGR